jgi:hypothetical protein
MGISCIPSLARNVPYENIDKIIDSWKLSNEDAANLRFVADRLHERELVGEFMLKDAQGAIAVHNIPKKWVFDYYEAINDPDGIAPIIKAWEVPVFPVNGNDVIALGFKPGKIIGEMLFQMKVVWAGNDFEPTKEQLLSICKVKG